MVYVLTLKQDESLSKFSSFSVSKTILQNFDDKTSGQSFKQFTLVIYKSRVVIWGIFKSGLTPES